MKYNINIPQPCHEDWSKMLPEQKGRHCEACKTVVTDFTIMTDAEIINHLKATASKTCGRFLETQLNRELIEPTKTYHWFNLPKFSAAASILFSLLQLPLFAQTKNEVKTEQTQIEKSDSTKQRLNGDIIIRGTILRAEDNKPMDFVAVFATKDRLVVATTYSYENGSFKLNIPQKYMDSIVLVQIKNIGFKADTIKNIALDKNEIVVGKIYLERVSSVLKGNIIVHPVTMGLLAPKNSLSNDSLKIGSLKNTEIKTLPRRDSNSVAPIYQGALDTSQIRGSRQIGTKIIIGKEINASDVQQIKMDTNRIIVGSALPTRSYSFIKPLTFWQRFKRKITRWI